MKLHPNFDEVKFPYIVVSGKNYFSWINIKENIVSVFILSGRILQHNLDIFFFQKKRYGYCLHFVAEQYRTHIWYEMQLKQDFHDILK